MNAIGAERDDPRLQSYSDWNLGWIEATRGNAAAGVLHCTRSLQRSPDPLNSAYSAGWLGFCYRESGDHAQAVTYLERSIEALRGFGYSRLVGWFGAWLADAYLWARRPEDARRTAAESMEVSRAVAYPWAIAVGTRAVGRIAEAGGDLAAATDRIGDALRQFAGIDAGFDAAVTRLDLARLAARSDDPSGARAHAETALAAFGAMTAPTYAERTQALLAGLSGEDGAGSEPARTKPGLGPRPLDLTSLGEFLVTVGGSRLGEAELGGRRGRELLAVLVAARAPVHRDRLIAWLWPGSAPGVATEALGDAIATLGRALSPERIVVEGANHRLALAPGDQWDAHRLLSAAARPGDDDSAQALERALVDCAAPPFSEWPTADWARPLRGACASALARLRGRLAEALLRAGRHDDARFHFAQLADTEPQEEGWHRGLMRCHAAAGDIPLALRQYHSCRSVLRQTRAADPSPETQALYLRLLGR